VNTTVIEGFRGLTAVSCGGRFTWFDSMPPCPNHFGTVRRSLFTIAHSSGKRIHPQSLATHPTCMKTDPLFRSYPALDLASGSPCSISELVDIFPLGVPNKGSPNARRGLCISGRLMSPSPSSRLASLLTESERWKLSAQIANTTSCQR
jgi:hypothetical protein